MMLGPLAARGAIGPLAASRGSSASPLLAKLYGGWKFDESSDGSVQVDRVDVLNVATLTDTNTTPSAAGKFGNGALFRAAQSEKLQRTTVDNEFCWGSNGTFTVAFWAYPTSGGTLISHVYLNPGARYHFGIYNSGGFSILKTNSAGTHFSTPAIAPPAALAFYMAWFDGSVLGASINDASQQTAAWAGTSENKGGTLSVGGGNFGSINALIDDVYVFVPALSAAERTLLYNAGTGRTHPFS